MSYNKNLYTSSTSALDAGIVYDQTETKMQSEVNAALKSSISSEATTRGNADTALQNTLTQLDDNKAAKVDLVGNIILSGVNTTGQTITKGTYFYNNSSLVRALADISGSPAGTITAQNTETVTAGGLNALSEFETINIVSNTGNFTIQHNNSWRYGHYVHIEFDGFLSTSYSENNDLAGIRKCLPGSVIRGAVIITTTTSTFGMSGILNNADGNIKQRLTATAPANSSIYFCFDYVL